MQQYKDSNDFVTNAAIVRKGAYLFEFDDCKKIIIEAYPTLDLCGITVSGEGEGVAEEEEEGATEEEEEGEAEEQVIEGTSADEEVVEDWHMS